MKSARSVLSMLWLCVLSFHAAAYPPDQLAADLGGAVEKGDVKEVRRLLEAGADPNRRIPGNDLDYTPLFLAVQGDSAEITKLLLAAGADPKIEDENGDPVMVHATDAAREEHAKLLIKHGVGIDSRNSDGLTSLMRGAPYEQAADIRAKLKLGADPNLTDPRGYTPLMIAADAGNLEAVKELVSGGAVVDLANPDGKTALMLVAARDVYSDEGDKEAVIIDQLVKAGANVNRRDPDGSTPLLLALKNWTIKPPMVEALLNAKPDVSIRNGEGRDALFLAVADADTSKFFNRIVELGGNVFTTDHDGVGLLMAAVGNADHELVAELLRRGLNPGRVTKNGQNVVHRVADIHFFHRDPFGADERDQKIAEAIPGVLDLLHKSGAVINLKDEDGDTPLHIAAASGNVPALKWLAPGYKRWDEGNRHGTTPLHMAAIHSPVESVRFLLKKIANIDQANADGATALDCAVAVDDRAIIQLLVERGANINRLNADGVPVLADVVAEGKFDLARFLVNLGANPKLLNVSTTDFLKVVRRFHDFPTSPDDYGFAVSILAAMVEDVDACGPDGITPLMWAASSNVVAALDALLQRDPNINARSKDGRTALMWAATSGADDATARLIKAGADASLKDQTGRTAADWHEWFTELVTADSGAAEGAPPLEQTIGRVRRDALSKYIAKGRYDEKDLIAGSMPLHLAAVLGEVDALETLLSAGVAVDQRMPDGTTALMEAAANGRVSIVQFLLEKGADPMLRDAQNRRALDHAAQLYHFDVAEVFLKIPGVIRDDELHLLNILIAYGDSGRLRHFLDAGVKILPPEKRSKEEDAWGRPDYQAKSPLVAAAVHPDDSKLKVLADYPAATGAAEPKLLELALHQAAAAGRLDNVRFLLEKLKVDPNAHSEDSFGGVTRIFGGDEDKNAKRLKTYTALSRALEEGHDAVVKFLIQKGAKPTGRTRSGAPPVTFCVIHERLEVLDLLLDNGADLEVVDFSGMTALHHAASMNNQHAVSTLLKHGANAKALDFEGRTALDLAREAGAERAVELLSN